VAVLADATWLDELAGAIFRQAEIENLGVAALGHKDVGGFDVAVDDALGMRGVEGVGDPQCPSDRSVSRSSGRSVVMCFSVWPSRNSMAMKASPSLLADVVDGANVGMVQGGSRLRFTLKTGQRLGISRHFVG